MWYKIKIETSPKQKGQPQTAVFYVKALGVKIAEDLALQAARTSKWANALSKNDVPFFKVQSIAEDRALINIGVGRAEEPFWRFTYIEETIDGEKTKVAYIFQNETILGALDDLCKFRKEFIKQEIPEFSAITKTKIEGVVYA